MNMYINIHHIKPQGREIKRFRDLQVCSSYHSLFQRSADLLCLHCFSKVHKPVS